MLLGISKIIDIPYLKWLLANACSHKSFIRKKHEHLVNYATDCILDLSALYPPTRSSSTFSPGFSIIGFDQRIGGQVKEPNLHSLFDSGEVMGVFSIWTSDRSRLETSSFLKEPDDGQPARGISIWCQMPPKELFARLDEILNVGRDLKIEATGDGYTYSYQYCPGAPWICLPAEAMTGILPGKLPAEQGVFTKGEFWFSVRKPGLGIALWEQLRELLPGKHKYSFYISGAVSAIERIQREIPGPYINAANGTFMPCEADCLDGVVRAYTCIPLGVINLKATRNAVWLHAIKVHGGWQLYVPASEIPSDIPKKRRPVILDEICEILKAPDLFSADQLLPLDGRTF